MKHFVVIELDVESESPMIGIIDNITNSEIGMENFKERLLESLKNHFDSDCIDIVSIPNLFTGDVYEDVRILVEGVEEYTIRIFETWFY